LSITWISNIKEVHGKPRLQFPYIWCLAAMLRDSIAAAVVVRTRPQAIPLAMRKFTHGFPFLSHDEYGALLGSPLGCRSSAKNYRKLIFPGYDGNQSSLCLAKQKRGIYSKCYKKLLSLLHVQYTATNN